MSTLLQDVFADTGYWIALVVKQDQYRVFSNIYGDLGIIIGSKSSSFQGSALERVERRRELMCHDSE